MLPHRSWPLAGLCLLVLALLQRGASAVARPATLLAVQPILECVVQDSRSSFTARFGYENDNPIPLLYPVLPASLPTPTNNRFSPDPADRGQPILFQPGRTDPDTGYFSVAFDGTPLTWTLTSNSVTASSTSPRCAADLAVSPLF